MKNNTLSRSHSTRALVTSAMIAALYAASTYAAAAFGLAYAGVQLRFSEALTILPVFTPFAIPGLTLGCFLGNLGSPFGIVDILCGTFASFLAAICSYALRKFRVRGIPWLAPLPAVLINAVIIGGEIAFFTPDAFWITFGISAAQVAAGQLITCYGLGIPLFLLINRTGIFKHL